MTFMTEQGDGGSWSKSEKEGTFLLKNDIINWIEWLWHRVDWQTKKRAIFR